MKLFYSPYFTSKTYLDCKKNQVVLGSKCVGSKELLCTLELHLGLSYGEREDLQQLRVEEYYRILDNCIPQGHLLRPSFDIDADNQDKVVSQTLLTWRDAMLMTGWDGKRELASEKLSILAEAEKKIVTDSIIKMGDADRWVTLQTADMSAMCQPLEIEVMCPSSLIPPFIVRVLKKMNATFTTAFNAKDLGASKVTLLSCQDVTEAYEWLACRGPKEGEVVVCQDAERLDSVLRSLHKPMVGEAQVGGHLLIPDVRALKDTPKSLVWLDCNGDYGMKYEYDFMNDDERRFFNDQSETDMQIPTKEEMLRETRDYLYHCLGQVEDTLFLMTAMRDTGSILGEHPIVTTLKHKGVNVIDIHTQYRIPVKDYPEEIRFQEQEEFRLLSNANPRTVVLSSSTLNTLEESPFDFVVKHQANLLEVPTEEDLRTLIGKVAHKVVEIMVEQSDLTIHNYERYLQDAIEKVDQDGVLGLSENMFAMENFKLVLGNSIEVLLEIIATNQLCVVGSEIRIPGEEQWKEGVSIEGLGQAKGVIDMLLQNDKGEFFIFDFKYSCSSRHADKLADNHSVQFELYRKLFDQHSGLGKVKAMGYYLFPKNTLYMSSNDFEASKFKGEHIEVVDLASDAPADAWKVITESYHSCMDELTEGKVKTGESYYKANIVLKNQIR